MTSCNLFEHDSSSLYSSKASNIALILKEAEEIIDDGPEVWGPSFGLEPTPLGPQGVETVVKDMPLTNSSWYADDMLTSLFVPLLQQITKRSFADSVANSTLRTEKVLMKHSMPWNPTEPEDRTSNGWPSQHDKECYYSDDMDTKERFRSDQAEQWNERFADLEDFRNQNGQCLVPHNFPENPPLAQWVKRQRYQYKLKEERRHSTLTEERRAKLEAMGFIWDSHKAVWEEKYKALWSFRAKHGHANVPSKYNDKQLAIWVKYQRRQHKLFLKGERSAMNMERVHKLKSVDFVWNPRNL
jgi:hypothetical protein